MKEEKIVIILEMPSRECIQKERKKKHSPVELM